MEQGQSFYLSIFVDGDYRQRVRAELKRFTEEGADIKLHEDYTYNRQTVTEGWVTLKLRLQSNRGKLEEIVLSKRPLACTLHEKAGKKHSIQIYLNKS